MLIMLIELFTGAMKSWALLAGTSVTTRVLSVIG